MILDATAGNRTMWEFKRHEDIIYIDKQKLLEVKPTVFCKNDCTPFKDASFDTIFYDPPHTWGVKERLHAKPNFKMQKEVYEPLKHLVPYYGWDAYSSRSGLVNHVYQAAKEFWRILKPDGLLWFKWNEMSISLDRILACFVDWQILMRLYIKSPTQTASEHQTYWVCLCKKKGLTAQQPLLEFL